MTELHTLAKSTVSKSLRKKGKPHVGKGSGFCLLCAKFEKLALDFDFTLLASVEGSRLTLPQLPKLPLSLEAGLEQCLEGARNANNE